MSLLEGKRMAKRFKVAPAFDMVANKRVGHEYKPSAYNDAYDAANARKQAYIDAQAERLSRRLNKLMAERNVTISQVRRDAGICFNTLQQLIQGRRMAVHVGTVWALAQYFNVDMRDFL